jgi:hypothetical protein
VNLAIIALRPFELISRMSNPEIMPIGFGTTTAKRPTAHDLCCGRAKDRAGPEGTLGA